MLRSKTFFTLHKIQYALRKTMHISQGIIKDERKSNITSWIYSEPNLKSMQEFELRVIK